METEEYELPLPCEHCEGTGEVGPYGWEVPEYYTCRACGGTGKEYDGGDADLKYEERAGK